MPRTSIAGQSVPFQKGAGITYTAADVANGMQFDNDGNSILLVKAGAAVVNVTVRAVPDEAGRSVDYVQALAANGDGIIGPLRSGWWNQSGADLGKVFVDFSAAASVAILRIVK